MKCYIDQSIKIENTNKTSYVSLANDIHLTASISSKHKQKLKLFFRELGKPIIFRIFTFSVLCAELIIKSKTKNVIIDREYVGHERQIKSFILQILRIKKFSEPDVNFTEIGKGSPAHICAYKAMTNKVRELLVTAAQVLLYYEKINKS